MSKLKNIVTQKVLSLEILMWNIKAQALTDKKYIQLQEIFKPYGSLLKSYKQHYSIKERRRGYM